jgi:hypothetical protein
LKAFDVEKKGFVGLIGSRKRPAILRCQTREIECLYVSGNGGSGIRSGTVNVKAFSGGIFSGGERWVGQTVRWTFRVGNLAVCACPGVSPLGNR